MITIMMQTKIRNKAFPPSSWLVLSSLTLLVQLSCHHKAICDAWTFTIEPYDSFKTKRIKIQQQEHEPGGKRALPVWLTSGHQRNQFQRRSDNQFHRNYALFMAASNDDDRTQQQQQQNDLQQQQQQQQNDLQPQQQRQPPTEYESSPVNTVQPSRAHQITNNFDDDYTDSATLTGESIPKHANNEFIENYIFSDNGKQHHGTSNNNNNKNNNAIINRELAKRIYNWEQEHRQQEQLPQLVHFSVRAGIRMVDELAREALHLQLQQRPQEPQPSGGGSAGAIISSTSTTTTSSDSLLTDPRRSSVYSDLIQEGLEALLEAMSHYPKEDSTGFQAYATQRIQQAMAQTLEQTSRPVTLPPRIRAVVAEARQVIQSLQQQGKEPTLKRIAKRMKDHPVSPARLQECLRLAARARHDVSLERTVQVSHPTLDDSPPTIRDREEWELDQGLLLDNGQSVLRDELVEDYLDEMMDREGDDDAWIQEQEQIAGSLQDIIPDLEPTLVEDEDDLAARTTLTTQDSDALTDMIRNDLSNFLTTTLEPSEVQLVRLAFGLDTGRPMSMKKVAHQMDQTAPSVTAQLTRAIRKLQQAYTNRYIEPYQEDDQTMDSV